MLYVPSQYYEAFHDNKVHLHHDCYEEYPTYMPVGFMVATYHDSDSEKDWNPIYKIVNRPETTTWASEGYTIADFEGTWDRMDVRK